MTDPTGDAETGPLSQGRAATVPPPGIVSDEPGFLVSYYEEFVSLLGPETASLWLDRLEMMLATAFADDGQAPGTLRASAHAMVPLAGTAGFSELARLCTELDNAISTGKVYFAELAAVQRETQRAEILLPRLRFDLTLRARSVSR